MSRQGSIRFAAALTLLIATRSFAVSTSIPPANQPLDGPQAALERYAQAWRDRSADAIGAVLTMDYTAHMYSQDFGDFVIGSGRDMEMKVMRNMIQGTHVMAPVDTVTMRVDGISENPDPEHPDSLGFYRVLVAQRLEAHFGRRDGTHFDVVNSLNVFHVVRGDVADLTPDQPADSTRWYIRRYVEDVRSVDRALADRRGDCSDQKQPAALDASAASLSAVPVSLAIHALTNPACAALEVRCDLPTADPVQVEVYDVTGRLVNRRDMAVAAPGVMTIAAGQGAKLTPGAYWVRLRQANQRPSTRMVVVAR